MSYVQNFVQNIFTLKPITSSFLSIKKGPIKSQRKDSSYVIRTIGNYSKRLNSLKIPLVIGYIPSYGQFLEQRGSRDFEYIEFENYIERMSERKNIHFINFADYTENSDYFINGSGHYNKSGYLKYSKLGL